MPIAPSAQKPSQVVVHRPSKPAPGELHQDIRNVAVEERRFWSRYTFFHRYPRVVGALALAAGALSCASTIDTLFHGGIYFTRGTLFGPVGVLVGAFLTITGRPTDREGRTFPWWRGGMIAATLLGLAIGAVLLVSLRD